jgi:hypothetical protein
MKNIDFKQLGLIIVGVLLATVIYERALGPMIDRAAD